ncbi:peptidase M36, partial [Syncephalis pseudoplumigaleata]
AMDGSRVVALTSWTYNAGTGSAYRAVPAASQDPRPQLQTLIVNPANDNASPYGWHEQVGPDGQMRRFTETIGNNVYAQENRANRSAAEQEANLEAAGQRPTGGEELVFDFPFDSSAADVAANQNASITNLFYLTNYLHDLFYEYGFDEEAGNFQESNGDRGGQGGDALLANVLDAGAMNDADMTVPPDGERPRMRIHVYNYTRPARDGAFANDIVAHEYMHGVTTRLAGGPANADCLAEGQSRGMAEGWSDFAALWLQAAANATGANEPPPSSPVRHAPGHGLNMGTYVNPRGLRLYDYSTDLEYNPLSYALMNDTYWQQPHRVGMLWAEMLYEMYWRLVEGSGLGATARVEQADLRWGNTLALQLVIDGLKLQPCRPTLLTARDAILLAEQLRTHGQHRCAIWAAFAKRGLGVDAQPVITNATTSF